MSPENACDVWILPEKLAESGSRPRVLAVPENARSVRIPLGNTVAAICPTMRYTALRTAVSWKQKVSGRCRDSVCSNILPLLSKVWLVMTAR